MKKSAREIVDSSRQITRRGLMLGAIQAAVVATLGWRLKTMQLDRADEFRLLSDGNSIKMRLLPPARGLIHDRNGVLLAQLQQRWARHRPDLRTLRAQIMSEQRHLNASVCSQVKQRRDALTALAAQLELLNPQRTLERGYAIVSNAQGQALRSPGQIKARTALTVRLAEGSAEVRVSSVQSVLE